MSFPRRGEIYWVNLDPSVGSEIAKTRPAVIISNDVGNQFSSRVIVAPVTSHGLERIYPFEVGILATECGLDRDSKVMLDQIRTMDKRRLGQRIGELSSARVEEINRAIRLSLGV